MGQLVDQHDGRVASQHRVEVELVQLHAAVGQSSPGQDLEALQQLDRPRPAVGLDETDDDVGAALLAPMRLLEHRERLADARRHAEVHPEPAATGAALGAHAGQHLVAGRPSRVNAAATIGIPAAFELHVLSVRWDRG